MTASTEERRPEALRPGSLRPNSLRPNSLRQRLLSSLLLAALGVWLLGGSACYLVARQQSNELLDASLASTASLLLRLVQHEADEHGMALSADLIGAEMSPSPNELRFQIWLRPKPGAPAELIYRSPQTPGTPFEDLDAAGYGWHYMGHARWRSYALWNAEHQLQIQLAESTGARRYYNRQLLWWLSLAALVLWPAMVLLVRWIITRSLAPLEQTAAAVATRTADDLHPIVPAADVPAEVLPLLAALNRLLARMRGALDYERQFTADAAHELRTPLAAIRAHAQVLQRARDDAERAGAASDVMAGVDRGGRVVDQLLALARVDANADVATESGQVDLVELVRQQCALHEDFAHAQGITIVAATSPARARAGWTNCSVLLRNLIDNALRYTPRGGRVSVGCRAARDGAELWVEDNGPGVAAEDRERIFERFYRVPGNDQFGSGLGLSIVRRIAELHGAVVSVAEAQPADAQRGARFSVRFAPVPAPSAPPENR